MPATPYDAKGVLIAAVEDDNPVILIEHRLLYYQRGPVPEKPYSLPPGKARIAKSGTDVTIVGISYMQLEAFRAARYLEDQGINAEVVDPIWLSPLDAETIARSVQKTGRLLIVDNGWLACGASAEIVTQVVERLDEGERPTIRRMGFAAVPCPTTPSLEDLFYPNSRTIAGAAHAMVKERDDWMPERKDEIETIEFRGPF